MTLSRWVPSAVAVLFVACGTSAPSLEQVMPKSVGEWQRTQLTPLAASDAPETVRQLGLDAAAVAIYTGAETATVRVYRMTNSTSAFELIQKWRQADGLAVYSGRYFLVSAPENGAGAKALLQSLAKELK